MSQPARNPHNLPTKICPACQRAFTWRKKWERDWENVRYCSDRCRAQGASSGGDAAATPAPSAPPPAKPSRRR